MKKVIIEFIKGIVIGIAFIIPGFSGGVMAVAFNVYDKIIEACSEILNKPIKAIKSVMFLFLGAIVGIVLSIVIISILLEKFPIPFILFFTGLIIGTLPTIFKRTNKQLFKVENIILFMIGSAFIIIIPLIKFGSSNVEVFQIDLTLYIILFLLGFLVSLSIIIPGVSGSFILLAFGYYGYITNFVMTFIKSITNLNLTLFMINFLLIFSFGLGIIMGIISFAKVIKFLLNKYTTHVYTVIIGILVASPFVIIYQMSYEYSEYIKGNVLNIILGLVFLIIGVFTADFISNFEKNNSNL